MDALGRNISLPIYNPDGTSFHGLSLKKFTIDSVIMSLGDKITGDAHYIDNTLVFTMGEYVEYDGAKYYLVNPPTVVREGMVSDNSDLKGSTKYSFEFYHPMYMLGNFPFTDVAVLPAEGKYLSQNKTFAWIGTGYEFIAKLNKNLEGTEWYVNTSEEQSSLARLDELSEVLQFDKNTIADALKKLYEEWQVPFVVSNVDSSSQQYAEGKRFVVTVGLPSNEILDDNDNPFVFRFGQGVGLKNNSRTPKNNKIVTRIAGYGSTDNVPFGYPQIPWTGNQEWKYTINNNPSAANSYPIYDGIVAGQPTKLIKHPFTRQTLMPSIYAETVNKKVNPNAVGYDPDTVIVDYYNADAQHYPNPIVASSPSYEIHGFDDIKPRLANTSLVSVMAYDDTKYISLAEFTSMILYKISESTNENEVSALTECLQYVSGGGTSAYSGGSNGGSYTFSFVAKPHEYSDNGASAVWYNIKYTSDTANFNVNVYNGSVSPATNVQWDDTMDDDGNYVQSYFKVRLPQLSFDLYASAAVTQEMTINMRSGDCLGCSFPVQVDWEDYKKNFYDSDGNFLPDGNQRNLTKYPKSNLGQIDVVVKKEIDTFGTLMPNIYQKPKAGDEFVFLGISMPLSYISVAEEELDDAMKEYMLENNVYYYDYPLKFDEYFLATHTDILAQIHHNTQVKFKFAADTMVLYVKQITVRYGDKVLPQYDITLTDDIEIVLNKIGQVTDDVSRMRVQVNDLQKYYSEEIVEQINARLSRTVDDVCQGNISFQQGLSVLGEVLFGGVLKSPNFETGLYEGRGWRIDELGNAEFESARIRSYLEVVELLVNRLQAEEGDTIYTDNDQIDRVDEIIDPTDSSVSYILSLKEKYDGYVTGQMFGNVIKGIINTLAAKQAGVSEVQDSQTVEVDGTNTYYTSWMRVIATHATNGSLGVNQIQVVLYGDNYVPAGKNFKPCELMTIARWGCVDYSDPSDPNYETVKASIIRRQRTFAISVTDGRVVKYSGVDAPILKNGNYGITIGELPEFVKNYTEVRKILNQVGEHTDWLYAQGVVVSNFIKVSREGLPVPTTVFCGDWVDGSTAQNPTIGSGIYLYNEYNPNTQQYEIHEVRHNGGRWQCLQHQPVSSGGVDTYYEPKWNSPYWILVDGNDNLSVEFYSSKGNSFRRGHVDTVITPFLYYGNVDISSDVAAQYWSWTRESENGKTVQDETWDAQHAGQRQLHLTNEDMPQGWSSANKAIFTCTVVINDGRTTRIVDNQIIS